MRRYLAIAALLLAGCQDELSPQEQAARDARDVALVEAANETEPPLKRITPDPIPYDDIERYDLYGTACNFAPGTSLGTRVIAREADAFLKVDGKVVRLAADPGSRELPAKARSLYSGTDYALRVGVSGEGKPSGQGKLDYEGTVSLRDPYGRVVYEGTGLAQCDA